MTAWAGFVSVLNGKRWIEAPIQVAATSFPAAVAAATRQAKRTLKPGTRVEEVRVRLVRLAPVTPAAEEGGPA